MFLRNWLNAITSRIWHSKGSDILDIRVLLRQENDDLYRLLVAQQMAFVALKDQFEQATQANIQVVAAMVAQQGGEIVLDTTFLDYVKTADVQLSIDVEKVPDGEKPRHITYTITESAQPGVKGEETTFVGGTHDNTEPE